MIKTERMRSLEPLQHIDRIPETCSTYEILLVWVMQDIEGCRWEAICEACIGDHSHGGAS